MTIHFITGNAGKFTEAKAIIPNLEQLKIDLPEIQDIDPHVIIKAKLEAAFEHHQGPFIVEDTSLSLDCLNGLPGPFIKWFEQALGNNGLYELAEKYQNYKISATTTLGLAKNRDDIQFFANTLNGTIVKPRGDIGFGWNPIFRPENHSKTFAEMTIEEKNTLSMRGRAFTELAQAL